MSDEPRKRTATEAMRLRPGAPADVARERAAGAVDALEARLAEVSARLDAVLELHDSSLVRLCLECLLPHPCRTRQLAEGAPPTPTPPEDASQ